MGTLDYMQVGLFNSRHARERESPWWELRSGNVTDWQHPNISPATQVASGGRHLSSDAITCTVCLDVTYTAAISRAEGGEQLLPSVQGRHRAQQRNTQAT